MSFFTKYFNSLGQGDPALNIVRSLTSIGLSPPASKLACDNDAAQQRSSAKTSEASKFNVRTSFIRSKYEWLYEFALAAGHWNDRHPDYFLGLHEVSTIIRARVGRY